jgi:hypothetical protein
VGTYRSAGFGVMFLCFDVAGVLGGLLDLLALGFLGGEWAGHDVWIWMECFDFYLWEEDLRDNDEDVFKWCRSLARCRYVPLLVSCGLGGDGFESGV